MPVREESEARRPTTATIDLDNLNFNFKSVKTFAGDRIRYMAVVKADAYGHGAVECARRLERSGADLFAVAIPEEGFELRRAGVEKPIISLGGFWLGQEDALLAHRITPVIWNLEKATVYSRAAGDRGLTAPYHVKIDTGMGRVGVRFDQCSEFAAKLRRVDNLFCEGIMTHFAAADDLSENEFTNAQIERFESAREIFAGYGFRPLYHDLANSPGAVAHPAARGNLVRLGGVLYGLSTDVLPPGVPCPALKPVLSLATRVCHLKNVPAGESIGYGRTFYTRRPSLIATIPIGYEDGFPRALSNRGRVIVKGSFAPVVGRVSMDWTIIDVTDVPGVAVDDEVILIGARGGLSITAEELAREAGTISYEITCRINCRIAKRYVGSQKESTF